MIDNQIMVIGLTTRQIELCIECLETGIDEYYLNKPEESEINMIIDKFKEVKC